MDSRLQIVVWFLQFPPTNGYDEISAALEEIHDDEDEKPEAKDDAGLASDMDRLES